MIKTRLVKLLSHTKKYIVQMVLWQWIALLGQIAAIFSIGRMVDCILMHQMSDPYNIYGFGGCSSDPFLM